MADTIRQRICAELISRLEGHADIEAVITPGDRSPDGAEPPGIAESLNNDKFAIELAFMDDEPWGTAESHNLEAWSFEVIIGVHMPERDAEGYVTAQQIEQVLYALCCADAQTETFGDLAIKTDWLGGGGVGISVTGVLATAGMCRIFYRHQRGRKDLVG